MTPPVDHYRALSEHVRAVWADREEGRFGAIVEPMLQWAKTETIRETRQVIPCKAGVLSGVVYANGDVSVCEMHEPLGNLREASFREIWNSPRARELRGQVAAKACWCTTEVFLWPSIVFQPLPLARSMIGGRVWARGKPPEGFSAESFAAPAQAAATVTIVPLETISRRRGQPVATAEPTPEP